MHHVPYKGLAPAVQDIMGGQIDSVFGALSVIQPLVASGKLRAFAVAGSNRAKSLPQVPTFAEVAALVHETTSALRLVPARPEPTPDSGAEQRRRGALLDLLANVAERHGCEESQILAQIGRTHRTLGPEDEPALLALLA